MNAQTPTRSFGLLFVAWLFASQGCTGSSPSFDDGEFRGRIAAALTVQDIQYLLDSAEQGSVVAIPESVLDGNLLVPEGVTLEGAGVGLSTLRGSVTLVSGGGIRHLTIAAPPGHDPVADPPGLTATGEGISVEQVTLRGWGLAFLATPEGSGLDCQRVLFERNSVGLLVEGEGQLRLWSSLFVGHDLAGLRCTAAGELDIRGNTFYTSSQSTNGAQISLESLGCKGLVVGNVVTEGSQGIFCDSCPATIENNVVFGHHENLDGVLGSNLVADPELVNISEGDFRPLPGSPASGLLTSYNPTVDFSGHVRPEGIPWDAGAFIGQKADPLFEWREVSLSPLFLELVYVGGSELNAQELVFSDGDEDDPLLLSWVPPVDEEQADDGIAGDGDGDVVDDGGDGTDGDVEEVAEALPAIIQSGDRVLLVDADWDGELPAGTLAFVPEDGLWGDGISPLDTLEMRKEGRVVGTFEPFTRWVEGTSWMWQGDSAAWTLTSCPPQPGDALCEEGDGDVHVVITELMEDGKDSFVEVENLGAQTVFMGSWSIGANGETAEEGFSSQPKIPPGGKGVVVGEGSALLEGLDVKTGHLIVSPGSLERVLRFGPSTAVIRDGNGFRVAQALTAPQPPSGLSVELLDPVLGDVPGNWGLSGCPEGHSAGKARCPADGSGAALVLRELHLNPGDENRERFVEVQNIGTYPVSGGGWALANDRFIRQFHVGVGADAIYPGGLGLFSEGEGAGVHGEARPGGQYLVVADDGVFALPFGFEDGVSLLHPGGGRYVDGQGGHFNPPNGLSLQHKAAPMTQPGDQWGVTDCEGGNTVWEAYCEELPEYGSLDIVEVSLEGVQPNEAFIEVFNTGGLPVSLRDWTLSVGGVERSLQPGGGQGMVVAPFARAIIGESAFGEGADDTVILEEDFEDGAVGVENWTALLAGDTNNALFEHGGDLVGSMVAPGAVGIVSKEPVSFAARGLWVESEFEMPFGPGGEVRSLLHLGSADTGVPSDMDQYLQLRFVNDGISHNLSLVAKASGQSPVTLWSWQAEPFCCPAQTQTIRLFVNGESLQLFYGPDDTSLLAKVNHGLSPESFYEGHVFIGWETASGLDELYETTSPYVEVWRPAFEFSEEALLVIADGEEGFEQTPWSSSLYWVNGSGQSFGGAGDPWFGTSMIQGDGGPGTWKAASCGSTPGDLNCDELPILTAVWWDQRVGDGDKIWKRIIGVPEPPEGCSLLAICSQGQDVLVHNLPAFSSFEFSNPFQGQTVRFSERSGPLDGCESGCSGVVHVVQANTTSTIPASGGGFYFAETIEGVKAVDVGILGGGYPPPEGLLPGFASGGGL